jgi:hypothetical protein
MLLSRGCRANQRAAFGRRRCTPCLALKVRKNRIEGSEVYEMKANHLAWSTIR